MKRSARSGGKCMADGCGRRERGAERNERLAQASLDYLQRVPGDNIVWKISKVYLSPTSRTGRSARGTIAPCAFRLPPEGHFPGQGPWTHCCAVTAPLPASLKISKAPRDQAGSERETPWAVQDVLRFCCLHIVRDQCWTAVARGPSCETKRRKDKNSTGANTRC